MSWRVITTNPCNNFGRIRKFSPETETPVEFHIGEKGYYEAEVSERFAGG